MRRSWRSIRREAIFAAAALLVGGGLTAAETPVTTDVFVSGRDGYHTYRIPALIRAPGGTLLAICEGRKTSRADHGDIDLVMRRSTDDGQTWGPLELIYEEGGTERVTIGNPCPVVDASTGTLWLPFCRDNKDVLVTSSTDDGATWSTPRDITAAVKPPEWGWYATGPGVGIQMRHGEHAGRMVIPCDHSQTIDGQRLKFSHVFYSDDHGQSWQLGGTVDRHTDECQVVELPEGELLINMRNYWERDGKQVDKGGMRAIARSGDGGATWSPLEFDAALVEPVCQASLIAFDDPARDGATVLAFANPASKKARRRMTLRASLDLGRTWPVEKMIDEGSAAYSSLARLPDGRIGLLYERDDYGRIVFVAERLDGDKSAGSSQD